MMRTSQKVLIAVAYIVIGLAIGGMILLTTWWIEPAPVQNKDYIRILLTPVVKQGEYFQLKIEVYWQKSCYSRVRRYIVDSTGQLKRFTDPSYNETLGDLRYNEEGWNHFIVKQQIPFDMTPGPAKWRVMVDWLCNPLQYWIPNTQTLDDVNFVIEGR